MDSTSAAALDREGADVLRFLGGATNQPE